MSDQQHQGPDSSMLASMQQHGSSGHPNGHSISSGPNNECFPPTITMNSTVNDAFKGGNMDDLLASKGITIGPDSMTRDAALKQSVTAGAEGNMAQAVLSNEAALQPLQAEKVVLSHLSPAEQTNAGTAISAIHNASKEGPGAEHG